MAGKTIFLINKSSRVYHTAQGQFHPGTTLEFPEAAAIKLLNYRNDIVKADESLAGEYKVKVSTLESKVDDFANENAKLKAQNAKLKAQLSAFEAKETKGNKSKK